PLLPYVSLSFVSALAYYALFASLCVFFFHASSTTVIYTLSLHDALPISCSLPIPQKSPVTRSGPRSMALVARRHFQSLGLTVWLNRKSTRLNSSHVKISYAVFCLKKKKKGSDKWRAVGGSHRANIDLVAL